MNKKVLSYALAAALMLPVSVALGKVDGDATCATNPGI